MAAVTILYGTEDYIMTTERQKFLSYWQTRCGDDVPVQVFPKDAAPATVVESLEGTSLFGSGSVTIWQDCPFLPLKRGGRSRTKLRKDELWFLEKVKAMPDDAGLLFVTKGNLDTGNGFFKKLKPLATVINAEGVTEKTIMPYVEDYVRQKGKDLTGRAAQYLRNLFQTWDSLSLLYVFSELDKLCITLGDDQRDIDTEDLTGLFAGTMEKNLFTFTNYFLRRDGAKAVPFIEGLFSKPDQFLKNTGFIVSRLRLLLAYKELKRAKMGERQCQSVMTALNKGRNTTYLIKDLQKVTSYWTIEELETLLSTIFTLQLNIRKGLSSTADMGPLICVYCGYKGRV